MLIAPVGQWLLLEFRDVSGWFMFDLMKRVILSVTGQATFSPLLSGQVTIEELH
jgi:hypothetical protein